jgi:hypothetical protein
MKVRLAVTTLVYAVVLTLGGLIITGHFRVGPLGQGSDQVSALTTEDSGSSFLLCGGCYYGGTTVTIRVTFYAQPSYGCCNYGYNSCYYGCGYNFYNPCSYGCYQPTYTYYNPCSWGCYQQPVYYVQPVNYYPVHRFHNHCGCWY